MADRGILAIRMKFVSTMISPLLVEAQENGGKLSLDDVPKSVLAAAREITESEDQDRPKVLVTQ